MAIKLPKKINPKTQPEMGFPLIKAGKQLAFYKKAEEKETKDGKGSYILMTGEIIAGPQKKTQFSRNFNIVNKNPVAVDMAYNELGAIARAVGYFDELLDTDPLMKKPFWAKFTIRNPGKDDEQNDIKGYFPVEGKIMDVIKAVDEGEYETEEGSITDSVDDSELEDFLDSETSSTEKETEEVEEAEEEETEVKEEAKEEAEEAEEEAEKMPWE